MTESTPRRLRSQLWFDDPSHADLTALYVERSARVLEFVHEKGLLSQLAKRLDV